MMSDIYVHNFVNCSTLSCMRYTYVELCYYAMVQYTVLLNEVKKAAVMIYDVN